MTSVIGREIWVRRVGGVCLSVHSTEAGACRTAMKDVLKMFSETRVRNTFGQGKVLAMVQQEKYVEALNVYKAEVERDGFWDYLPPFITIRKLYIQE